MTSTSKRKGILDAFKESTQGSRQPPSTEEVMLAVVDAALLYRRRQATHQLTEQDKAAIRSVIKRAAHLIVTNQAKEYANG